MKTVYCVRLIVCGVILFFSANAAAAPVVSSKELISSAHRYDGKTIVYEGEAIGDIMRGSRGRILTFLGGNDEEQTEEFVWLNVRDADNAMGVFCPGDLTNAVKRLGSYKCAGDRISVQGIFNRCCTLHGGDMDIHAEKIVLLQRGQDIAHPVESEKARLAIILSAAALMLALAQAIVQKVR